MTGLSGYGVRVTANATTLLHIIKKSCNSVKSYYWRNDGALFISY